MYVASWSGGKDSTATIILAHEKNEPLDLIVFSEVMFDREISGELPEHIEFIHRCIKVFAEWGYKTEILRSDVTYMDVFNHVLKRSRKPERIGKKQGFPMAGKCKINRDCKLRPIKQFEKDHPDTIHYVGIAIDEPKRLERLKPNCISLLAKYRMSEADAYELCEIYDMLSPVYTFAKRGGCWFCPNAGDRELRHLRNYHRELWDKLIELERQENLLGWCWNTLKRTGIQDKERQFNLEDQQISIFDYIAREANE